LNLEHETHRRDGYQSKLQRTYKLPKSICGTSDYDLSLLLPDSLFDDHHFLC